MRMCKRAAVCGIGALRVAAVSTAVHTAAAISALTWKKLSAYSRAISQDTEHPYSNAVRAVMLSDGQTLGVGDYLNISVSGVNYQVDIIGFRHDRATDASAYGGDYAGITWQMHHLYAATYPMNSSTTNSGGWTNCLMRTSTMAALLGGLASELSAVLVPADKPTSAGSQSSTINTTSDRLFLLSEMEVRGSTPYTPAGEGAQYAYYAAGNSAMKSKNGSAEIWWERSPTETSSLRFCTVSASGGASYDGAASSRGVAFAFCT